MSLTGCCDRHENRGCHQNPREEVVGLGAQQTVRGFAPSAGFTSRSAGTCLAQ